MRCCASIPFTVWPKSPVVTPTDDFADPAVRERLVGYMKQLNKAAVDTDAKAHLAFLDAQGEVDTKRKLAVTGYCMGGPMTIYTAAQSPSRVGAAASFHGGGVGSDKPDSPHLLIPEPPPAICSRSPTMTTSRIAEEKNRLKAVLTPRKQWHEVEVYKGAMHGWCPPDGRAYNEEAAEKAWGRMLELFKASL